MTTYNITIGSCSDTHLTAERALYHIVRAEPGEEVRVYLEDGTPCRIEADLDDECLQLWCGDDCVAVSEPVDGETLDRWCA